MQINKNKTTKKRIILTIGLLLTAVCAIIFYLFTVKSPDAQVNTDSSITPPTRSESDKKQTEELGKNPDNKSNPVNTDAPAQPTAGDGAKKNVSMVASVDSDSSNIYIRGGVNALVYSGACYVQLSGPNSENIKRETTLIQNPSTTDCKTITISKNELSRGKWTFTLNYESNEIEGITGEKSFTL